MPSLFILAVLWAGSVKIAPACRLERELHERQTVAWTWDILASCQTRAEGAKRASLHSIAVSQPLSKTLSRKVQSVLLLRQKLNEIWGGKTEIFLLGLSLGLPPLGCHANCSLWLCYSGWVLSIQCNPNVSETIDPDNALVPLSPHLPRGLPLTILGPELLARR